MMKDEGNKEKDDRLGLSIHAEYIDAFMLHDIFVMADKDRDDCLNFNELSYAFKLLGFDSNQEDVKSVLADRNIKMKEKKFILMALDLIEKDKLHADNVIQTFKMITNAAYEKGKNTKYMDTNKLLQMLCEGDYDYTTNLTYEEGLALCSILTNDIGEEADMYRLTNALLNIEESLALEPSSSTSSTDDEDKDEEKVEEGEGETKSAQENSIKVGTSKKTKIDRQSKYSNAFVSSVLSSIEEDEEGNIMNEEEISSSLDYSGRGSLRKSVSSLTDQDENIKNKRPSQKDLEKSFFLDSLLLHVTGLDKNKNKKNVTTKSVYFKNMLLSPKRMSTVLSRVKI